MKGIGMSVIVYGHVAHSTTVPLTPPIYLKQLGVVFFLFATGFTLARERRQAAEVLFNRLFQIYLFGVSLAVLMATKGLLTGSGLGLSNFLPFLGGANVAFDNFPANPTTWYLGTYLHFLILWAVVLRRVRVQMWMVALAIAVEIAVRALLMARAGGYIAYMLMTNWSAVFLLGMVRGGEDEAEPQGSAIPYAVALVTGFVVWGTAMRRVGFDFTFPFMSLQWWPGPVGVAMVSAAVSILYVGAAALTFEATRRLAAPAAVQFIARNSLIIFLAHMPVFFALHPVLVSWGLGYWPQVAVQMLVCLAALAVASEWIHALVQPERLRVRVFATLVARRHPGARPGMPFSFCRKV